MSSKIILARSVLPEALLPLGDRSIINAIVLKKLIPEFHSLSFGNFNTQSRLFT